MFVKCVYIILRVQTAPRAFAFCSFSVCHMYVHEAIASLPQDRDIIDCVKHLLEREEEKEAAAEDGERFNGEDKNGKEDEDSDTDQDDQDVPMNLNGPEQCGATGSLETKQGVDQVTRGYIGIPPNETTQSEEE
eukprot:scaffold82462_cov32-Attheya_sp.AAC.3